MNIRVYLPTIHPIFSHLFPAFFPSTVANRPRCPRTSEDGDNASASSGSRGSFTRQLSGVPSQGSEREGASRQRRRMGGPWQAHGVMKMECFSDGGEETS